MPAAPTLVLSPGPNALFPSPRPGYVLFIRLSLHGGHPTPYLLCSCHDSSRSYAFSPVTAGMLLSPHSLTFYYMSISHGQRASGNRIDLPGRIWACPGQAWKREGCFLRSQMGQSLGVWSCCCDCRMNGFQNAVWRAVPKEAEEPQGEVKGLGVPCLPPRRGGLYGEQQRENLFLGCVLLLLPSCLPLMVKFLTKMFRLRLLGKPPCSPFISTVC